MNKVVYVMDCGDFVKIGVSSNVKRRSKNWKPESRGRSTKKNLKKSLRQMNFTDASGTGTRNITKQKRKQGHCNLLSNVIITLR